MSDSKYDIIFRGDVVAGNNIVEVKQRLAQLFKIDAAKVDALFTGRAVPLKRNVDLQTAEKYKAILLKAGAQVSIKDLSKTAPSKSAPQSASSDITTKKTVEQPAKPLTLKERLAKAAEEEEALEKAKAAAKIKADSQTDNTQNSEATNATDGAFDLAPVGAVIGVATQRDQQAVEVDVSHLSANPAQGELLSPSEKKQDVVVDIDVSEMDLAEVGADLLAASEKAIVESPDIEIGDYGIADVGSDLLADSEKPKTSVANVSDANFDLAPVGSDVGQIKKPTPPPPPDTSSLSLAD